MTSSKRKPTENFQNRADTTSPKVLDSIAGMGGGAVFVLGLVLLAKGTPAI